MCYDLFGEIPVTYEDIEKWLDHVAKIPRTSPNVRRYYVKHWQVIDKIKAAKIAGYWHDIDSQALPPSRIKHLVNGNVVFH